MFMSERKSVLFICTHNSARSQMAEGYLRARFGDRYEAFSGGTEVTEVHPVAIAVMNEIGIDISGQRSKRIDEFYHKPIDIVVTVCEPTKGFCPFFPGNHEEIHFSFPDPSCLTGTDEEVVDGFRTIRDAIIASIEETFGDMDLGTTTKNDAIRKVNPHPEYPPEEGRYLRGNDYSPVAVAIVLNTDADKIPQEIDRLVRAGIETGAALSGTVQTANIGIEKIICNIVSNTNIRYLILGGPESAGHRTGEALKALFSDGTDEKKRIIGTDALSPSLFNVPVEFIDRIRKQVTLVDCQFKGEEHLKNAVRACYQETPTAFGEYSLYDPGAYPGPPLSGKLTWSVTKPWSEPEDEKERIAKEKMLDLIARMREKQGRET
jgi:thioredoxin type arsenate reductase